MRQFLFLTAISILALTLAACGTGDNNGTDANQEPNDVTNNEVQDNNTAVDDQTDNNTNDTATGNNNTNDTSSDNNNASGEMQTKMDELDYVDFELSVEYDQGKEYEASLEKDQHNGVEADLEDQLNGVNLGGQEAFDTIYPNVKKLKIDQQTNKDDAIKQALDAFSLEPNYKEFELELKFKDGTKLEFKDKK